MPTPNSINHDHANVVTPDWIGQYRQLRADKLVLNVREMSRLPYHFSAATYILDAIIIDAYANTTKPE